MHLRRSALLGAVLAGSSSLLVPGGTADAATFSLSVNAVDRTGAPAAIAAHLVNLRTGSEHDVRSGHPRRLAAGTYSVAASIWGNDDTATFGVRIVKLDGTTRVSFDARKGHRVGFSVDDATAETRTMQLVPRVKVAGGGPGGWMWALNPLQGAVPPTGTYVIPTKSSRVALMAYAHLEKKGSTAERPSPYRFDLVHRSTGGLPSDATFSYRRTGLAKVTVTARSAATGESGILRLVPSSRTQGSEPAAGETEFGSLPARIVSYRSPGQWNTDVDSRGPAGSGHAGFDYNAVKLYEKGSTSETYRTASWGPSVGTGLDGRYLWIWPRAVLTSTTGFGGWLSASGGKTVKLYHGSKLLGTSNGEDLKVKLPTTTAWYTLTLNAARTSADALSAKVTATWRFKAHGTTDGLSHGGARVFTGKFAPRGLDSRNTAAHGTTTTVGLKFGYSSMRSVAVEASFDGGRTWRHVTARRSGSGYVLKIKNPGSPGAVSLRLKATEGKGSSLAETIINAYGVQ